LQVLHINTLRGHEAKIRQLVFDVDATVLA